jgi:hypothetical protein
MLNPFGVQGKEVPLFPQVSPAVIHVQPLRGWESTDLMYGYHIELQIYYL